MIDREDYIADMRAMERRIEAAQNERDAAVARAEQAENQHEAVLVERDAARRLSGYGTFDICHAVKALLARAEYAEKVAAAERRLRKAWAAFHEAADRYIDDEHGANGELTKAAEETHAAGVALRALGVEP